MKKTFKGIPEWSEFTNNKMLFIAEDGMGDIEMLFDKFTGRKVKVTIEEIDEPIPVKLWGELCQVAR